MLIDTTQCFGRLNRNGSSNRCSPRILQYETQLMNHRLLPDAVRATCSFSSIGNKIQVGGSGSKTEISATLNPDLIPKIAGRDFAESDIALLPRLRHPVLNLPDAMVAMIRHIYIAIRIHGHARGIFELGQFGNAILIISLATAGQGAYSHFIWFIGI